jgi:exopolyphosphatase/pppGpp-phosphohydrolase
VGLLALEAIWGAFGQVPLQIALGGLREGVVMRALDGRS